MGRRLQRYIKKYNRAKRELRYKFVKGPHPFFGYSREDLTTVCLHKTVEVTVQKEYVENGGSPPEEDYQGDRTFGERTVSYKAPSMSVETNITQKEFLVLQQCRTTTICATLT